MDDVLIWCYRKFGPTARKLGIQRPARRVYEWLASHRYPSGALCSAVLNGRIWKLRRDVAERGELEEFGTVEWLRQVVRPGMTVIDIGANVGQMTLEIGALVGPSGRVIAIEPGAGNLEYLRQHVDGNGFANRVTIIEAACSSEDGGEIAFFVATPSGELSAVGNGHNILSAEVITKQAPNLQTRETRVPRVSLDGLCRRLGIVPAVIKIDVEGAEILVLKGAEDVLRRMRPQVRVGFHPFAFQSASVASAELFALAEEAGYRLDGVSMGDTMGLAEYNLIPDKAHR
jgi:FkbM family methyltransferase